MEEKISNRPYSVALTGGIGSGKSTVGDILKECGAFVIDSDHIVHELLGPDSPFAKTLKDRFGAEVIGPNNAINRAVLGDIVFNSPEQRKWLENLLHPKVYEKIWDLAWPAKQHYCVMLIPLLFESHHENDFDRVLVVDVPEEVQIKRVKERSDYSEQKIRDIIAAQIPRNERLVKADDVVSNDLDLAALRAQVIVLHEKYLLLAKVKKDSWKLL